jgi:hypothetical protein
VARDEGRREARELEVGAAVSGGTLALVAAALFAQAPSARPDDDASRLARAVELANGQRFAEARPLLEAYVAAHAQDATALAWLAYAQLGLGESDAALASADRAVAVAPTLGPAWYQRGRALLLRHDFASAGASFRRCRELAPDFFPTWRDHFDAIALLGGGDERRAAELWSVAHSKADDALADPAFLFESTATLFSIVPDPEPARGWYRRAAKEFFVGDHVAAPVELPLPVRGEWLVSQGNFGDESHFGIAGSFSFDLGRLRNGELFDSKKVRERKEAGPPSSAPSPRDPTTSDFFTYDEPVHAPAAARVVRVVDDVAENDATVADHAPLADPKVARAPLGNHVVLELGKESFLLLAHLRAGTVKVRPDESVQRGAELARIGQSGVSYAPHLHLTAWRSLDPPIGRPLRFVDCTVRRTGAAPSKSTADERSVLPQVGDVLVTR